jgi:hypothetical protein
VSIPCARQASRIVEPAGTLTVTPSIETSTGAGIGRAGAVGGRDGRAAGLSTISVSGWAADAVSACGARASGAGSRSIESPSLTA